MILDCGKWSNNETEIFRGPFDVMLYQHITMKYTDEIVLFSREFYA